MRRMVRITWILCVTSGVWMPPFALWFGSLLNREAFPQPYFWKFWLFIGAFLSVWGVLMGIAGWPKRRP